jgi:hypothetical protein
MKEYHTLESIFINHTNQPRNAKNKNPNKIVETVITIDTINDTNIRITIGNGSMTINNPMK